jgi:hypothetical protein
MQSKIKLPEVKIEYLGEPSGVFARSVTPLLTVFKSDSVSIPFCVTIKDQPGQFYPIVPSEITIELYSDTFFESSDLLQTFTLASGGISIEGLNQGHFIWVLSSDVTGSILSGTCGFWAKLVNTQTTKTLCKGLVEVI